MLQTTKKCELQTVLSAAHVLVAEGNASLNLLPVYEYLDPAVAQDLHNKGLSIAMTSRSGAANHVHSAKATTAALASSHGTSSSSSTLGGAHHNHHQVLYAAATLPASTLSIVNTLGMSVLPNSGSNNNYNNNSVTNTAIGIGVMTSADSNHEQLFAAATASSSSLLSVASSISAASSQAVSPMSDSSSSSIINDTSSAIVGSSSSLTADGDDGMSPLAPTVTRCNCSIMTREEINKWCQTELIERNILVPLPYQSLPVPFHEDFDECQVYRFVMDEEPSMYTDIINVYGSGSSSSSSNSSNSGSHELGINAESVVVEIENLMSRLFGRYVNYEQGFVDYKGISISEEFKQLMTAAQKLRMVCCLVDGFVGFFYIY